MAASNSTQQPQAGPRAVVPGQRLLFASDIFFNQGIVAAPRTQLSCAPTRSLTDEMLRGRRHDTMVAAGERVSRRFTISGSGVRVSSYPTARLWRAAGGSQRCQTTVDGMVYVRGACVNRDMARGCYFGVISLFGCAGCGSRVRPAHVLVPRDVRFLKEIGPSGRRKASPLSARAAFLDVGFTSRCQFGRAGVGSADVTSDVLQPCGTQNLRFCTKRVTYAVLTAPLRLLAALRVAQPLELSMISRRTQGLAASHLWR
jgi:hypothetical protein